MHRHPHISHARRRRRAAGLVGLPCLLLLTALAVPTAPAEAKGRKPSFTGYTSLDYACSAIKWEVESLVSEYKNASAKRRSAILNSLSHLGKRWDQICRSSYGDVGTKVGPGVPESVARPAFPGTGADSGKVDPGPSTAPAFRAPDVIPGSRPVARPDTRRGPGAVGANPGTVLEGPRLRRR